MFLIKRKNLKYLNLSADIFYIFDVQYLIVMQLFIWFSAIPENIEHNKEIMEM